MCFNSVVNIFLAIGCAVAIPEPSCNCYCRNDLWFDCTTTKFRHCNSSGLLSHSLFSLEIFIKFSLYLVFKSLHVHQDVSVSYSVR